MKTIKRLIAIFMMIGATSCTENFEQTNTNPDSFDVPNALPSNMFTAIVWGSGNDMAYATWFWNNELIQYTSFSGGTTRNENIYDISDANWANRWNLYSKYANNAQHMYELASRENDYIYKALALTWKVFYMSELTSMFGDIPYKEAFQGRDENIQNYTPVFDSQKDVFTQMFADLDTANYYYANYTSDYFSSSTITDPVYGADIAKWRKFNNSIYVRLLTRVSGRSEMNVGAKLQEMLSNPTKYPIFESNDDNAKITYTGTDPYLYYFNTTDFSQSDFTSAGRHLAEQIIKLMVLDNGAYVDPRLPIYGKFKGTATTWEGAVAGCPIGDRNSAGSLLNYEVLCRGNDGYTFMSYDELLFDFAEAALKGYISGGATTAKDYYEKAVTASMQKWGALGQYSATPVVIADADITTYLARPEVIFDATASQANLVKLLAEQKYIALFWVGMEAWHEYRRTGYPELVIGAGTLNDHILPTRFAYPTTTMATNATNANAALQNMGGANDMKTPLWWSKQAIGH